MQLALQLHPALAQLASDGLEPSGLDALSAGFEESLSSLPLEGPFFLAPAFVEGACRDAGLPPEVTAAAHGAARTIRANRALTALTWHCHRCLYVAEGYPTATMRRWPSLAGVTRASAEEGSIAPLYLLVLLSGIDTTNAVHRTHSVPTEVRRETLYDVQRWLVRRPVAASGAGPDGDEEWFLPPRYLGWLRNHFRGELYHLVRLQFQFGMLWGGAVFFRHRQSGAVVALSEDGLRYRPDGDLATPGETDEVWTARLVRAESETIGHPIDPSGPAQRREVRLAAAEWEQVLAPGDPVLHLHIPAGSPMDYAQCGESLGAAVEFFPWHFPERPYKAFACSSWLLDRQLEAMLPETSNIVRLQREVYQLPSRPDGRSALERVFGREPADRAEVERLPRDTSLRRALADLLLSGGDPRGGRCVLFPDDLDWGTQVYRRRGLAV